jgi:hypothetical protein
MIEFDSESAKYLCNYSEIGEQKHLTVGGLSTLDENEDELIHNLILFIQNNDINASDFKSGLFCGMGLGINTYHYVKKLYIKKLNFEEIKNIKEGIILLTEKNTYFYINNQSLTVFNVLTKNSNLSVKSAHIINPNTNIFDKLKISLNIQQLTV